MQAVNHDIKETPDNKAKNSHQKIRKKGIHDNPIITDFTSILKRGNTISSVTPCSYQLSYFKLTFLSAEMLMKAEVRYVCNDGRHQGGYEGLLINFHTDFSRVSFNMRTPLKWP